MMQLQLAIKQQLLESGISDALFGRPINLAPAMLPIYQAKREGRIVELSFMCPTAARRREVMTAKGGEDLRNETYHKSGIRAIGGNIQIFRTAVEWYADDDNEPLTDARLLLPGTIGLLNPDNPSVLYEARIPHITGRLEYDFMLKRLSHYVGA